MAQRVRTAVRSANRRGAGQESWEQAESRPAVELRLYFLAAIFFLSGAAGLIYELLWLRILALTFGVTSYAITTVLAGFMSGLAFGSMVAGPIADRIRRPLRAYALVEVLIGITGALTPVAFTAADGLYQGIYPFLAGSSILVVGGRFVMAFAIMLVPTSLMGATLPILLRSSLMRSSHTSSHLSLLYALNTFGAIAGCLATPFFLVGSLGIRNSIFLAALLNLIAAALATLPVLREKRSREGAREGGSEGAREREQDDHEDDQTLSGGRPHPSLAPSLPAVRAAAFWGIGVSGLLSLAYEVVWARLLATVFDATVYSFAIMLATYLFGLAAGSAAVKPLLPRRLPWPLLLALVEGLIGVGALFSIYFLAHAAWSGVAAVSLRYTAMVSFVAIFPATFLMGASFPIAAEIFTAGQPDVGRRVGSIYAVNVCGSIVGSLLGGFALLPALGVERSVPVLVAGNALLCLVLLVVVPGIGKPWRFGLAAGTLAFFVAGIAAMPPIYASLFARRFPHERVVWRHEGIENTVTIADRPEMRLMVLNGHHQANDQADMVRYHRLIGHLPMLLHPAPRHALVIGLGGGATPGAIARYPGVEVDCVELSAGVVGGARYFAHVNDRVLEQPNVRLRVDDGRNHLLLSGRKYDVITADVIVPFHAGAGNLYSAEYYALCRDGSSESLSRMARSEKR